MVQLSVVHYFLQLSHRDTVQQVLTMVSEPGAVNRVHQQPQIRQAINQVQGPYKDQSGMREDRARDRTEDKTAEVQRPKDQRQGCEGAITHI